MGGGGDEAAGTPQIVDGTVCTYSTDGACRVHTARRRHRTTNLQQAPRRTSRISRTWRLAHDLSNIVLYNTLHSNTLLHCTLLHLGGPPRLEYRDNSLIVTRLDTRQYYMHSTVCNYCCWDDGEHKYTLLYGVQCMQSNTSL